MSEVLYIQTEKNVQISSKNVCLKDIAVLSCADEEILARNQVRRILTIPDDKAGRYVISIIDIIKEIQKHEKKLDITHIGEEDIVLTYEKKPHTGSVFSVCKTIFVCIVTFFGAAFSIMTFNTDVDASGLFSKIYEQFMGVPSDGFTVLEIAYSIGIGLGVIFYFNHFGKLKLTKDPTPMQVEMRLYEEDIDKTIVEEQKSSRGKSS